MTFRLNPDGQRIEPFQAPHSRERICDLLALWPHAPIEIHPLGREVKALDVARRSLGPDGVELVLVAGMQPAAVEAAPDAYSVAGKLVAGRALLTARRKNAPPLGGWLTAPAHFLRPALTGEDVQALIDWRATRSEEPSTPKRYDVAQLRAYADRLCAVAAEAASDGGGVLRLYAVDPYGAEAGSVNLLAGNSYAVARYALDNFDRGHSTYHEWTLRANAPLGSVQPTPPIRSLAELSESADRYELRLRCPTGDVYIAPGIQPWKPAKKGAQPRRVPVAGVPVITEAGESLVRWERAT